VSIALLPCLLAATASYCGGDTVTSGRSGSPESQRTLQLIITGAPGAGKGTQSEMISNKYGIPHISTGEILRAEAAQGTELGKRVAVIMQRGELVDDETMLNLVERRLIQPDCQNGFILDGFPRTLPQAVRLEAMLDKRGTPAMRVLNLRVPAEALMARLLARKRADDTENTIRSRLEVYMEQTAPLIEYYERKDLLTHVNGDQTIGEVFEEIVKILQQSPNPETSNYEPSTFDLRRWTFDGQRSTFDVRH
jgi:adenylate kinase